MGSWRGPGRSTRRHSHRISDLAGWIRGDAATCYLLPVLVRTVVRNPACPQSARPPAGIIHVDFRRKQLPEIRSTTIR
jgi:hypothetical protein